MFVLSRIKEQQALDFGQCAAKITAIDEVINELKPELFPANTPAATSTPFGKSTAVANSLTFVLG